MEIQNIYATQVANQFIERVNKLTANTSNQWGKMDVSQMMAHCNVSYEMAFNENYKKSSPILRFILKNLAKKGLVNESPLKKNSSTASEMIVKTPKVFEAEKRKLISNINNMATNPNTIAKVNGP